MPPSSLLARLALPALPLAIAALLPLAVACTDGYLAAEELPTEEVPDARLFGFVIEGEERARIHPPLLDARMLAAHPEHARFAVSDGRRLWLGEGEELRELPLNAGGIEAMVVDGQGVLWLLRGDGRLQSVDASASANANTNIVEMPPLPLRARSLYAGAGHLVALGTLPEDHGLAPLAAGAWELDEREGMAISADGYSWELRRRPWDGSEFDDLTIDADGRMWLMDGDERSCGGGEQSRWMARLERPGWKAQAWDHDYAYTRVTASQGWTYVYDMEIGGLIGHLSAVTPRGGLVPVLEIHAGEYAIEHAAGRTMVATPEGLFEIEGRRSTRVGAGLPETAKAWLPPMVISASGALVAIEGQVWRSEGAQWRALPLAA